jgi:hypothetical protein
MSAELIAKMRGRIEQCRRLAKMINDPQASQVLLQMAEEGEADLRKFQAEEAARPIEEARIPPPQRG